MRHDVDTVPEPYQTRWSEPGGPITEVVITSDARIRYVTVGRVIFDQSINVHRCYSLQMRLRKGRLRAYVVPKPETPKRHKMHAAYNARRRRRRR